MADPVTSVRVRSPRTGDFKFVVALENESFADPWEPGALEQELRMDSLRLPLIAELEGKVVGYLMAWKVVDQLHILNIAADPRLRRCGVGTVLLRTAAGKAAELGLSEVTLEVRESNLEALGFYLRHGFRQTGLRRGYYADDGEDAIIMTCPTADITGP